MHRSLLAVVAGAARHQSTNGPRLATFLQQGSPCRNKPKSRLCRMMLMCRLRRGPHYWAERPMPFSCPGLQRHTETSGPSAGKQWWGLSRSSAGGDGGSQVLAA